MDEKMVFQGVEFRAGMHLWSNPKLRGTPAEIPIILARPTLFDVVILARRYPLDTLHAVNRRLRAYREISERQYLRTVEILRRIERVRAAGALNSEDVVAAVAIPSDVAPDTAPDVSDPVPSAVQWQHALAAWLPAGLPTVEMDGARVIRLEDAPWEFETPLRRWLRWHLNSAPTNASMWLIGIQDGQALSHVGWCAFLSWLTDALLCRLDQMEIGT